MVYYSKKYAEKKERELFLKKARDLISNPRKYTRAINIGVTRYTKI